MKSLVILLYFIIIIIRDVKISLINFDINENSLYNIYDKDRDL